MELNLLKTGQSAKGNLRNLRRVRTNATRDMEE